ncbi:MULTISPECIES: glycine--tRNA ligase [Methanobacterium]|jgi:glycyl-tRNA synthetase|uniref:glycine--tRNA ligase n=1 Tax=Methanobacterium subterraneum TaxID=59277 RepID=A0A2H4VCU9_9EURY|nr:MULTISPECIES: glycine--tRNA ligase [Methanobacterium]AUB55928.1 glycine--tRNA ligase [Methanobacterium subterraneum]AUB57058.1 glycine--tRNA ligase [Methanobacterium sp. MZ-A1]NMO09566.1 glycine--tRNA ligase [Methanobacterium subterraneum]
MKNEDVMNIAKKRGFLWSSFEIYSGVAGFFDYGPLGAILKNKIMNKWREYYLVGEGFYEIESPTIMPEEALKASGHVDHFNDPMTECKDCLEVFRADHIIKETIGQEVEGLENQELTEILSNQQILCPRCEGHLTHVWSYNLMFQTLIGAKGKKTGYMRPETAQGIFIPFKRLLRFYRGKLPFGVVQLGKAYRNEISPRQGVIRLREFTQAEAEIFVDPRDKKHPRFHDVANQMLTLYPADAQEEDGEPIQVTAQEAVDKGVVSSQMLTYQLCLADRFMEDLGIPENVIRFRQHMKTEMAHYAIDCWDVEIHTDRYGWVEVIGIADRSDFDLKSHSQHSREDLSVFMEYDEPQTITKLTVKPNMKKFGPLFKGNAPKIMEFLKNTDVYPIKQAFEEDGTYQLKLEGETYQLTPDILSFEEVEETVRGEKVYPHVIEPSYGIDRITYSVLLHTFTQEDDRNIFHFPADLAPVGVNVFPLVNKDELVEIANKIMAHLRVEGIIAEVDTSGTIGRRYARSDEIGTPFAVTADHQSLEDNTVTIRERDSQKQVRVLISEVPSKINDLMVKKISFNDL